MSMVANRVKNIRAALCSDHKMAILARQHNDANVLVLGSRLISLSEAIKCLLAFLNTNDMMVDDIRVDLANLMM